VTVRARLTRAVTCSTTTRTEERSPLRKRSSTLSARPWGFFGLGGQHAVWLIALKASVFVQGGVGRIGDLGLIGGLLVRHAARGRRAEINDLAGHLIDPQQVLIGMGLLLAAVVLLWPLGVYGPLLAALSPIDCRRWRPCQGQRTGGETARIAFWGMPQVGQGVLQHGE